MTAPAALARHVVLAAATVGGMLVEDPALLVVQASRRLPRGVAGAVADVARRTARGHRRDAHLAVAAWLDGHRDVARAHLVRGLRGVPRRAVLLRRVLGEVAVDLDVPVPGVHGPTAARHAWRAGRVDDAVALARGTALEDRLASARALMSTGTALTAPPRVRPRASTAAAPGPRALHVLVNSLPHTPSGYALRSHAVLRAQRAAGVDARAVTRIGYPVSIGRVTARDVDVVDDVIYHRLLPWSTARLPAARLEQQAREVAALVARHRPTVLHTTTDYTNALVTQAVAAATDLPWVYEVRGLLEDTWAASFPTPDLRAAALASPRHALLRAREAELAAAADHVVVLGATVRDDLVARGVDGTRITVVPNGVDADLLGRTTPPDAARRALGLPGAGFWIGTITSVVDYEGVETLVEAVAVLREQGVPVRAAVVGDGVALAAVERRVRALGLDDHVLLPGRVGPAAAARWYEALDVFVVPRRDTRVTRTVVPLKPMQAMALGRPVVASDLPALAEVVGAPGAGLLAPADDPAALADAVARLAADPDLAARLASAGRRFAAGRTWAAAGAQYRAVYERLAA